MKGKGYAHGKTVICQKNKSATLLENNGKKKSRKSTKHINTIYFLWRIVTKNRNLISSILQLTIWLLTTLQNHYKVRSSPNFEIKLWGHKEKIPIHIQFQNRNVLVVAMILTIHLSYYNHSWLSQWRMGLSEVVHVNKDTNKSKDAHNNE